MQRKVIWVSVFRYSPDRKAKGIDKFEVPYSDGMTIQTALRYIYENIDPTLAFRDFRCGQGLCNTCCVRANGRVLRSCETVVLAGQKLLLEPANDRIIRDLVVQLD